jgi:hypothetical protein
MLVPMYLNIWCHIPQATSSYFHWEPVSQNVYQFGLGCKVTHDTLTAYFTVQICILGSAAHPTGSDYIRMLSTRNLPL